MTRYALTSDFEKILGTVITERSKNAMVRCPFHNDDVASLSIDLERGFWICFGCGEKGNIFGLARRMEQDIDREDVLARSARADESRMDEPQDFTEQAYELHKRLLVEQPLPVVQYLLSRGLDRAVLSQFALGWDGTRISMPYLDGNTAIAIKYRYPNGAKTYEPGSRHYLYNVDDIRGKSVAILCEGESDTHAVWSWVYRNPELCYTGVSGVPGVGVGMPSRRTWELYALELLWAKRVYIAFDADSAGDAGSQMATSILGSKAVRMRPTVGNDMADHLMKGGTLEEAGLDFEDLRLLGA